MDFWAKNQIGAFERGEMNITLASLQLLAQMLEVRIMDLFKGVDKSAGDSGEAERGSGIGLKVFGFIAESVFAFIPESCSGSSRNAVRHHPGIAFILPRIPQSAVEPNNPPQVRARNSGRNFGKPALPRLWPRVSRRQPGSRHPRLPQG
jgi:hypothetical protein